jgi:hypothetical protein
VANLPGVPSVNWWVSSCPFDNGFHSCKGSTKAKIVAANSTKVAATAAMIRSDTLHDLGCRSCLLISPSQDTGRRFGA